MRISPLVLLAAIVVFGCADKEARLESPASESTELDVASETEDMTGVPDEYNAPDPMITFIRTYDGQSQTSKVLLSSMQLSEFPPPYFDNPNDIWDKNVTVEVIIEGDQRTQILSYNTEALASEYVEFYKSELSGAKEESGDSSYIVRGKNEFGDDVVMEYILPPDASDNPLVRITVVEKHG